MIGYVVAFAIVCLIIAASLFYIMLYKKVYVLDDNITYRVLVARPNKHTALKILHDLNHKSMSLIKQIKMKYANRLKTIKVEKIDDTLDTLVGKVPGGLKHLAGIKDKSTADEPDTCDEALKLILQNYNPDLLVENDPLFTFGDKTYTLNFKRIAICIRKNDWSFYDFNTLMFVFLHEIAHTGTHPRYLVVNGRRDNHPPMFWRVFKFLLREAVELGYIVPIHYSAENYVTYCGIPIQNNPLFDESIRTLI